ncbi:hypothetical protein fugu_015681 [Takifugu bimaculatus]|uniref:SRCR domain-containing protein n=1 Tax=Takifugu bimaculatus TaxID=433685 RepID=A0A4Z2BZA7_9TELE|nr:hypothetical protein fugu_015681 [Takifugu bimaculatus]
METIQQRCIRCLASSTVSFFLLLSSSTAEYSIRLALLSRCSGRVEVYHNSTWKTLCDEHWGMPNARVVCRQVGCGSPINISYWNNTGHKMGQIWLGVNCSGQEGSLQDCQPTRPGLDNCSRTHEAAVTCSDPMLLILTAAGIVLLILLVLLVTCVAVWRKRKVTHSRVITQNQIIVESYDSTHDYEKVDGEKAEHADLGDRLHEDSFQGEPSGGSTAEDEEEEEADYVNVTTECNVQFVEIYGEGVSSSNVPVLNATSEDGEFIDIYGEEDCIYQNMELG